MQHHIDRVEKFINELKLDEFLRGRDVDHDMWIRLIHEWVTKHRPSWNAVMDTYTASAGVGRAAIFLATVSKEDLGYVWVSTCDPVCKAIPFRDLRYAIARIAVITPGAAQQILDLAR